MGFNLFVAYFGHDGNARYQVSGVRCQGTNYKRLSDHPPLDPLPSRAGDRIIGKIVLPRLIPIDEDAGPRMSRILWLLTPDTRDLVLLTPDTRHLKPKLSIQYQSGIFLNNK